MSEENISKIFTEGRQRLLSIARHILGDRIKAEDVIQDAFCRLWPNAVNIRSDEDAARIASVTVRNLCIDTIRVDSRYSDEDPAESSIGQADLSYNQESDDAKERFDEVCRIINSRLTASQQAILQRHDIDGCSYKELATEMGATEEALRQQLSRARKAVRDCYRSSTEHISQIHRYE